MSFQSLEKVHAATMAGFMAKLAVLETAWARTQEGLWAKAEVLMLCTDDEALVRSVLRDIFCMEQVLLAH
jgi:hypothetical protein